MASANLKAFVSETELKEQRERRQEEWDKVRTEEQPEECPEEVYDPRSLFEKLQAQKDKKQSDFEEQFKFKNMVRGIDDGESSFLNDVAEKKMKIEAERLTEEKQLISQCKESIVNSTVPTSVQHTKAPSKPTEKKVSSSNKRSQAALLAGAVKRKRPNSVDDSKQPNHASGSTDSETTASKMLEPKSSSSDNGHHSKDPHTNSSNDESGDPVSGSEQQMQCIAVLPGIGSYSNSSEDSDSDSSDSEGVELIKTVFHKGSRRKKCHEK